VITQLVFVGHHKERLLESIKATRELPTAKIILFVGEEELAGEERVREVADELKKELEVVWDVEISRIDKRNTIRAALQLIEKIKEEELAGRGVIINASGSLRNLAIAGYIAACVTNSRIFTSIPKYDEKWDEVGIEEIIEIPTLPIDFPAEEQMEILSAINGGVDALDELINRLNPGIKKDSEEFTKERSRVSHHIAKLERLGAVRKIKRGRNVRIELTALGQFLIGGVGIGSEKVESEGVL
jgi:CRISPR-associated protein Csa3